MIPQAEFLNNKKPLQYIKKYDILLSKAVLKTMEIVLHIELKKIDKSYEAAIGEYFKRISSFSDIKKKLYKDISKLQLQKSSYVFLLEYGTESASSEDLADKINRISLSGYSCIEFIVAAGNTTIIDTLNNTKMDYDAFTFSSMRLNNDIASVCLAEQIYRAFTINNNISYHK